MWGGDKNVLGSVRAEGSIAAPQQERGLVLSGRPSLSPAALSKAVLDGVPGHEDTWPLTPTLSPVPSPLASLSLQVHQEG